MAEFQREVQTQGKAQFRNKTKPEDRNKLEKKKKDMKYLQRSRN